MPNQTINLNNTTDLNTTSLSGLVLLITSDLVVNNTFTFKDCIIKVAAGKSIKVQTGKSLTLKNCSLFACTNMWAGITAGIYLSRKRTNLYSKIHHC
jgi:hypothetical protein